MKKVLLLLVALFGLNVMMAQNIDLQRIANLKTLIEKAPKACGIEKVDAYASATTAAALMAIKNSASLEALQKSLQDGTVADNTNLLTLAQDIKLEADAAKAAAEQAKDAAEALKEEGEKAKNGSMKEKMSAGKRAKNGQKVMEYAAEATTILSQETIAQGTTIAAMLKDAGVSE